MQRDNVERLPLPVVPEDWDAETQGNKTFGFTTSYFPFDQAVSAFQKAARRGMEGDAIQWSLELFYSGKARRTNIWNRHIVVSVEDVGPADVNVFLAVKHLMDTRREDPLAIATSAVILARAKKCRANDWACIVRSFNLDTEDEPENLATRLVSELRAKSLRKCIGLCNALTFTTKKIKIGRTTTAQALIWESFQKVIGPNSYLDKVEEMAMSPNWKWKNKSRLLQMHVVNLWTANAFPNRARLPPIPEIARLPLFIESLLIGDSILGVPDYALDRHTRAGRKMARSDKHFFEVGSLLVNESEEWKARSDWLRGFCVDELLKRD